MKIVFFVFLIVSAGFSIVANADPLDLVCKRHESGYLPYNKRTNHWIGKGSVASQSECHRMIDKNSALKNIVCSWNGYGFNIFNLETGLPLDVDDPSGSNWTSLATCGKSIYNYVKEDVICLPRGEGSGVFDISNNQFIGPGYYFDIDVCNYAVWSATAEYVCAPNPSYTSIYRRRYNELTTGELFFTSEQCSKVLKYDHP